MTQNHLRDHTGGNRDQHVVAAILHPLLTTSGLLQAVVLPVVHHILVAAILLRHFAALMPLLLGTSTARVILRSLGRRLGRGIARRLHGRTRITLLRCCTLLATRSLAML